MGLLRRLGNPARSEAAAFRWLVVCGSLIVAVSLLVVLLRAVL